MEPSIRTVVGAFCAVVEFALSYENTHMRDTLFAFGLIGAAALPLVEGWWLARWMRNKGYTKGPRKNK